MNLPENENEGVVFYKTCPLCDGIGHVPRAGPTGATMRKLRNEAKISLNELSRRMGISQSLLCRMELGEHEWTRKMVDLFQERLKEGIKARNNL